MYLFFENFLLKMGLLSLESHVLTVFFFFFFPKFVKKSTALKFFVVLPLLSSIMDY